MFFGNFLRLQLFGFTLFSITGVQLAFAFTKGINAPYYLFGNDLSSIEARQLLGLTIIVSVIYFLFAIILLYVLIVNLYSIFKQKNPNNHNFIISFVIFVFSLGSLLLKNQFQARIIEQDSFGILDAIQNDAFSSITPVVLIVSIVSLIFAAVFRFSTLHKEDIKQFPDILKSTFYFFYGYRQIIFPGLSLIAIIALFVPIFRYQVGTDVIFDYSAVKLLIETITSNTSYVQQLEELGYKAPDTVFIVTSSISLFVVLSVIVNLFLIFYHNIRGIQKKDGVNFANRRITVSLCISFIFLYVLSEIMKIIITSAEAIEDVTPTIIFEEKYVTQLNLIFLVFAFAFCTIAFLLHIFMKEKLSEKQAKKEEKYRKSKVKYFRYAINIYFIYYVLTYLIGSLVT